MKIISEKEYLKEIIGKLNSICGGWILGDDEANYKKIQSADLVNHPERFAIEVKDDFSEAVPDLTPETPMYEGTRSTGKLSNRYKHDIEGAHKKFKNYNNYETAVIIRFKDFTFVSIYYILGGLARFTQRGRISNTDINISRNCSNCSLFVFHNMLNYELQFYRNPISKRKQDRIAGVIKKLCTKEITSDDFVS